MILSTTTLVLVATFFTSSVKSSFNYNHLNLPFESVIVSVILTFSAPFKTYTNEAVYLVRRQRNPSDDANAWIYDDHPSRPCSHHGPFYRQCPVCLKSIPAHTIVPLHTVRHIPHYTCTTPAPHASIFYSPVVSVDALNVKIPICIFTWMLPSFLQHHPPATPPSQPIQQRPCPRKTSRQLLIQG